MATAVGEGVVVVDKGAGLTSMRVVERVKRITKHKKAGHAGTLDPAATGVLAVCLGQATKIANMLLSDDKEYLATVRLGVTTDTYDLDGIVVTQQEVPSLSREDVEEVLRSFRGTITQRPPIYSALRQGGERLYKKARRGEKVDVPERQVVIHELEITEFSTPNLGLRVACGKGTYIRSLASDIGEKLGCGGALESLRRTRAGRLTLEQAHTLEQLEQLASKGELASALLTYGIVLSHLPSATLDVDQTRAVRHGQPVQTVETFEQSPIRLLDEQGGLVALAEQRENLLKPRRVFQSAQD